MRAITREMTAAAPRTVLIVDDEPLIRDLARTLLAAEGWHVLEAGSAEEALSRFAEHETPIDLLLTDVSMPGLDGRELAKRLCALRPEMSVLFMSSYSRRDRLWSWSKFLPKPFARADLVRLAETACAPATAVPRLVERPASRSRAPWRLRKLRRARA